MARIIVNSDPSYQRGDVNDNRSHPGTNGDDTFIISPDSHGFPLANDDDLHSAGADTFYLNTDVDAANKIPHPYQEGGGEVSIENFGSDDKIIIPDNTPFNNILIFGYGYVYRPHHKDYIADFTIVYDPHDLYWSLFAGDSIYDMSWQEGIARIIGGTSRNTVWYGAPDPEPDPEHGDPRAIRAKVNQLRNPEEWNALQKSREEEFKLSPIYRSGGMQYAADQLAEVYTVSSAEKPVLHTIMRQIFNTDGTSLYDYAFDTNVESASKDTGIKNQMEPLIPQIFIDAIKEDADQINEISQLRSLYTLTKPQNYKRKFADKVTNFNPSTDTLEVDTDSLGIDSSFTFAAGKNKKAIKKLAKQDFDFLYDQKKGGLYFNENGSDNGFGDGGIIAILKGSPDLTSVNLEFI